MKYLPKAKVKKNIEIYISEYAPGIAVLFPNGGRARPDIPILIMRFKPGALR